MQWWQEWESRSEFKLGVRAVPSKAKLLNQELNPKDLVVPNFGSFFLVLGCVSEFARFRTWSGKASELGAVRLPSCDGFGGVIYLYSGVFYDVDSKFIAGLSLELTVHCSYLLLWGSPSTGTEAARQQQHQKPLRDQGRAKHHDESVMIAAIVWWAETRDIIVSSRVKIRDIILFTITSLNPNAMIIVYCHLLHWCFCWCRHWGDTTKWERFRERGNLK